MDKKVITLNLTDCKTWDDFYERIRLAFGFPEWFGKNLPAFWDLLRGDASTDEAVLIGTSTVRDEVLKMQLNGIIEILERNIEWRKELHENNDDIPIFLYKIEN